jgi:hypothetical protein
MFMRMSNNGFIQGGRRREEIIVTTGSQSLLTLGGKLERNLFRTITIIIERGTATVRSACNGEGRQSGQLAERCWPLTCTRVQQQLQQC